ncbi:MAG: TetR/AcrR family transcriptional regulator [Chloroflexi bacterium]|uniref:TetR/AcrR family transcriptional regulator n=1 Tax=Candidatus Chlorohelix allophototropha TaxID=3003348 RepID=A0A8T7M7U3_9CHLR|nr:TetR/AcrR family transcriptional regulator [Chloroflexota bacterium]WJW68037.1 TetR/AcrR family transcriptional regulator [Chloroflexota bacterium L227-S17]
MTDRQDRSHTRIEKILDAAVEIFSRKGYRDSGVDDIVVESQTSKGGIYFHFPNKQAIFLTLLDRMANLLHSRAEEALNAEPDLLKKGDALLLNMLKTFGSHRRLTQLFLVEALGAGHEFNDKIMELHGRFSTLVQSYLDELVKAGVVAPINSQVASIAWFGAVNETVTRWILTGQPVNLEDAYPTLRLLLRRGVGLN